MVHAVKFSFRTFYSKGPCFALRTEPPGLDLFWFLNDRRNFSSHHNPADQITGITGLSQFPAGERIPGILFWVLGNIYSLDLHFYHFAQIHHRNLSENPGDVSRAWYSHLSFPYGFRYSSPEFVMIIQRWGLNALPDNPSMCCNILIFRDFLRFYPKAPLLHYIPFFLSHPYWN